MPPGAGAISDVMAVIVASDGNVKLDSIGPSESVASVVVFNP